MNEIRVVLSRAGRAESVHRVVAAAVAGGRVAAAWGEAGRVVWLRSCAKPFQGLAVMESGACDVYGFTPAEVATICGSHLADAESVAAVRSMLRKAGLGERHLRCGAHPPIQAAAQAALARARREPSAVHNNCSGKHAGMLAACRLGGYPTSTYLRPSHPVQRANLAVLARLSGVRARRIGVGVDGCSAPVFRIPVSAAARAMASFSSEPGTARRIREAMTAHPARVGRPCARIMGAAPGRVVAKVRAEGVYLVGLPGEDVGLALKVLDGAVRPIPHVVSFLVSRLGLLDAPARARLAALADPVLRNHAGLPVGRLHISIL